MSDVLPASRVIAALAHNPNVRRGEVKYGDRLTLYLTNSGISHHVLRHLRALGWEVIGISPRSGSVTCKPATHRMATPKTDTLAVEKHRGRRIVTDGGSDELGGGGLKDALREGFHEYGEVRCTGCGETVDLSDADDLNEAAAVWNVHVNGGGSR